MKPVRGAIPFAEQISTRYTLKPGVGHKMKTLKVHEHTAGHKTHANSYQTLFGTLTATVGLRVRAPHSKQPMAPQRGRLNANIYLG